MSALARFLHPIPASRRAYSSFFSSKPGGGGRYFNSAKPPKVVPGGAAAKSSGGKVDPSTESTADGVQATPGGATTGNASGGNNANQMINADQGAQSKSSSSSSSSSSATNGTIPGVSDMEGRSAASTGLGGSSHAHRQHPVITPKDFKLHQFFSLHRPLLLLAQPSTILHSSPPGADPTQAKAAKDPASSHPSLLDEFSEASMDADAAAARQLTRALTINHAGATVAWEDTLRRLGLDVDKDADRIHLKKQMDKEWEEVMLDSVKRKRRKKMKKHKLKKRRKATRASRVKIGR